MTNFWKLVFGRGKQKHPMSLTCGTVSDGKFESALTVCQHILWYVLTGMHNHPFLAFNVVLVQPPAPQVLQNVTGATIQISICKQ